MSAHTPGPWAIINPENARGQKQPPRIHQPGKAGIIATIGFPPEGTREANALLIAAAPELLDALHRIAYGLETDGRTADGMTKAQAAALARAAIAQAEGSGK